MKKEMNINKDERNRIRGYRGYISYILRIMGVDLIRWKKDEIIEKIIK